MKHTRAEVLQVIDEVLNTAREEAITAEEQEELESFFKSEKILTALHILSELLPWEKEESILEVKEEKHPIEVLGLSARTYNALYRDGRYQTIEHLLSLQMYDLKRIRNLGEKGIHEIQEKLAMFKKQHS